VALQVNICNPKRTKEKKESKRNIWKQDSWECAKNNEEFKTPDPRIFENPTSLSRELPGLTYGAIQKELPRVRPQLFMETPECWSSVLRMTHEDNTEEVCSVKVIVLQTGEGWVRTLGNSQLWSIKCSFIWQVFLSLIVNNLPLYKAVTFIICENSLKYSMIAHSL
jgi:hypothetical protein